MHPEKRRFHDFIVFLLIYADMSSTRDRTARKLDVSESMLEDWIAGIDLPPPPEKMRLILRVHSSSSQLSRRLAEIENLPVEEISHFNQSKWQGASTLVEYLCLPFMTELRRAMSGLTLKQREEILRNAVEAACKLKE